MEKSYYLSTTFNDVVFKNRNQRYGAYQLRKVYEHNIKFAAICATALFITALYTPLIKARFFPKTVEPEHPVYKDHGRITVIDIIPEIEKPRAEKEVIVAPKEKVKTEVYTEPNVIPDDAKVKEELLANQEDLKGAAFGTNKIEGTPLAAPDAMIIDKAPTGLDTSTGDETNTGVFVHVEEMPEFNGGEKAMLQYIGKKINYPSAAQRENIQGLVVVTFVIASNGEIKDAEVIKSLGYGTDEEALRVVRGMPNWKPGKQNGQPVAVRYTLPIRFSMR